MTLPHHIMKEVLGYKKAGEHLGYKLTSTSNPRINACTKSAAF